MKKNDCCEGEVITLRFPNKGMVRTEESEAPVLVKNTLPGQRVRFRVKKARKTNPEGILMEILEKSPLENAEPPCPHFDLCGGCAYQTMDYENQRALKLSQVQTLLKAVYPDFPLATSTRTGRSLWAFTAEAVFMTSYRCRTAGL